MQQRTCGTVSLQYGRQTITLPSNARIVGVSGGSTVTLHYDYGPNNALYKNTPALVQSDYGMIDEEFMPVGVVEQHGSKYLVYIGPLT